MRQTKWHDLLGDGRRPAQNSSHSVACDGDTARKRLWAALDEDPNTARSNLATLKAVVSNHSTLLARVRRRNDHLRTDNARMELELAGRTRKGSAHDPVAGKDDPATAMGAAGQLRWIEEYLHGTLAQTLWALNVRAARLEEHVAAADRQEARRVLELTHAAYDQLRSLMTGLRGRTDD